MPSRPGRTIEVCAHGVCACLLIACATRGAGGASGTGGRAPGISATGGGGVTDARRDAGAGVGGMAARGAAPAGSVGGQGGLDASPGADAAAAPGTAPDAGVRDAIGADDGAAGLPGWALVWSDEFSVDGAPDPGNWGFETGFVRNQELQWYEAANAAVGNGVLTIEGRREQVANPNYQAGSGDWTRNRPFADYTSASLTTAGKRTFTYGRIEARARIDVRQGSWPAFWTLGTTGGWPGGGEVDIMEFYAGKVLANVCRPAGGTCGWSSITKPVTALGADWASQFHVWAMEWDATTIDLYLDGTLMNHFDVSSAVAAGATNPYVGRPMYIIVNLALGGTNGGDPTATTFPMTYEIDYVRVYQRAP
jgi:beta-glucanase (GH16 family)